MSKKQIPHSPLEGDRPELSFNLHDNSEEQISIIVVHKDRPEYLNICLQSIAVTSINNNYELIVVDNGSGLDSQNFLDEIEQDGVKIVRNKKNLYWAPAINKGVEVANKNSKYYVFMHCDVVVLNPGWLDLLINVSESRNSGLVGLELNSYYMQQQKIDFIPEWCMLVTKDCWKDIGPFPESVPQVGPAFIFTLLAQQKGHSPQVMSNSICHHYHIFSLDLNEYEKLTENAMTAIPTLLREMQSLEI